MEYDETTRAGPVAFGEDDTVALSARATQILLMAEQLTRYRSWAEEAESSAADGSRQQLADEARLLEVPVLTESERERPGEYPAEVQMSLDERMELWHAADVGDSDAAGRLIRGSIADEAPIVRAAAAVATLALDAEWVSEEEIRQRPEVEVLRTLAAGHDLEARRIAETFAHPVDDDPQAHPRWIQRRNPRPPIPPTPPPTPPSSAPRPSPPVSIGVHGTFAHFRRGALTPMHNFYRFLRDELAHDLYPHAHDYFRWGGRYTKDSRAEGVKRLHEWADAYGTPGSLRVVFAHSHGGNVALSAAAAGFTIERLILLATPAIQRTGDDWAEIRKNVGHAATYRTHLDRVILADQLVSRFPWRSLDREPSDGLNFPDHTISGIFQPSPVVWLRHSSWLREKLWRDHGIDASVRTELNRP